MEIAIAIVMGLLFGAALQRVGATNPENILNMLRLHDLHLMKAILFGVGLSSFLLFAGLALGGVDPGHLSVKDSYVGVIVGGALLGVGFGSVGYCPGTGLGGMAEGRRDGLFFSLGGLVGAGLYMLVYRWIEGSWLFTPLGGKVTLAANGATDALISGINGFWVAGGLGVLLMVVATVLPQKPAWSSAGDQSP